MKTRTSHKVIASPAVILLLLLVMFGPLLMTNYMGDDMAFNIGFKSSKIGIWDFTWDVFSRWWFETGRITYLAWLAIRVSLGSIGNLLAYKLYLVAANIFAVASFFYMCKSIGTRSDQMVFLLLCFGCTVQIRGSSDPYATFHGLLPLCSAFIFLSLAFYLEKRRWLSLLAFLGASLFYEVGYIVVPLVCALAYMRYEGDINRVLKDVWPYLALFVSLIAVSMVGKYYGKHTLGVAHNTAYTINIDLMRMLEVIAKQMAGSLPLNYLFLTDRSGNSGVDIKTNKILWIALLVMIPSIPLFVKHSKTWCKIREKTLWAGLKPAYSNSSVNKRLAVIGAVLWITPGMLISISPKYQDLVRWSQPYVTNYLSAIGVSLIIFACANVFSISRYSTLRSIGNYIIWLTLYACAITTSYNYYNAYLLRQAWAGQDFVKAIVWENPRFSECTARVYSNKWRYWEERLFKEVYTVDSSGREGFVLGNGECAVTDKYGDYKIYWPGETVGKD